MNENILLQELQRLTYMMENYCQAQAAERLQMCLASNKKLNKMRRKMT